MSHTQPQLTLPNPDDWMDVGQALAALRINRSTLYLMIKDGRLGDYRIGVSRVFWRTEIKELAAALERVRVRRSK